MDEDSAHSDHVASLALQIFDATAGRHGLGDDSREVLEAAALLANVGLFVSHAGHHKHSYYVIRNSEMLTGFTDREIELIAQVARYHRKSAPRKKHPEFAALDRDDQLRAGAGRHPPGGGRPRPQPRRAGAVGHLPRGQGRRADGRGHRHARRGRVARAVLGQRLRRPDGRGAGRPGRGARRPADRLAALHRSGASRGVTPASPGPAGGGPAATVCGHGWGGVAGERARRARGARRARPGGRLAHARRHRRVARTVPPFRPLLGHATYVGFDPDRRELHTEASASGRRVIVAAAVVAEPGRETARFFLTRNPTASSTLRPLADEVAPYLRLPLRGGRRGRRARHHARGGARVAGIDRVDWVKLDTQGTDLRLLDGLDEPLFATLMAVDAEPGFDQHYETEDTFGELHRSLVERGFWLADLELTRAVRLRRQTFDAALGARQARPHGLRVRAQDQPGRRAALPAHAGVARQGGGRAGRLPAPLGLRLLLGQPPYSTSRSSAAPATATIPRCGWSTSPCGATGPTPGGERGASSRRSTCATCGASSPSRTESRAGARAGSLASLVVAARVLVIDNYDSFVYNLVQYLGELGPSRWCTGPTS